MPRPTDPLQALVDATPSGVELSELTELVDDDLAGDDDLQDLLGRRHPEASLLFEARPHVPRIRPVLVALAARSAGASSVDHDVQHVAELLHLTLTVHDLALGREGSRRRRVARRLIKRSVGFLGGHHFSLRAMELARHGAPPEVMGDLLDTLREFAEGEALARELQRGTIPTERDWLDHADSCTGALFAFCCRAGGALAHSDQARLSALGRYGRHMGRVWNVAEDVSALLHTDGPNHVLARALAGRPMLPVIRSDDPEMGPLWSRLVVRPSPALAEQVVQRVWSGDGIRRARTVMARESWAARRALSALEPSPYRRAMERLARSLAKPPKG